MQSIKEIANEYMLLSASQHEFRHIQYYTKVDTVTQLLLDMHQKVYKNLIDAKKHL